MKHFSKYSLSSWISGCWSLWVAITFLLISAWVFLSQPRIVGFAPGHHGWVSSHSLAIIENTSLKTGMVGYSIGYSLWENGKEQIDYNYFSRSPWMSTTFQKGVIELFASRLPDKVQVARQMMNSVFVACLFFSTTLLFRIFGRRSETLLAATLLSFSGYYAVYFKDMVAPDQWTVLGFLILLNAIAYFQQKRCTFAALSLVALTIGWGYSSAFLFLFWALLENAILPELRSEKSLTARIMRPSWIGLCFAGLFSAGVIFYQISIEAKVKGISLLETDILHSALVRTRLVDQAIISGCSWREFGIEQSRRLFSLGTPYVFRTLPKPIIFTSVLAVIVLGAWAFLRQRKTLDPFQKLLWSLLLGIGFFWLIPMKGLSGPHHYTAIAYAGFFIALWSASFQILPQKWDRLVLAVAMSVFCTSVHFCDLDKKKEMEPYAKITEDFEKIRQSDILNPGDRIAVDPSTNSMFQDIPYSIGFYLSGKWIVLGEGPSNYFLTRKHEENSFDSLNQNQLLFLGQKKPLTAIKK